MTELMTERDTAKDALDVVEVQAREAHALVGTLESAVLDGDETVTVDEIEKARGLARFTRLREEAAARRLQAAQDAVQAAAFATIDARAHAAAAPDGPANHARTVEALAEFEATVRKAVRTYIGKVHARAAVVAELFEDARTAGVPTITPGETTPIDPARYRSGGQLHIPGGIIVDAADRSAAGERHALERTLKTVLIAEVE